MINLLPDELKTHYRYARLNARLRRWVIGLIFGLASVGLVTTAGLLIMQRSIDSTSHNVAVTRSDLQSQKLDQTRKQAAQISSNLKLAVTVLSREVLFSKLLNQVAAVTPANTSLTNLTISQTTGALDITAVSSDYQSATQLQVNLSDPANQIFQKADIQNISCSPLANDPRYPCTVTIRALFATNNPFLFINKGRTP